MDYFLSTLMTALAVGSLYALIALGYTMVYGILKFINFAHSDVFVLGAWTSLAVATGAGWGDGSVVVAPWIFWAAGGVTLAGGALLGLSKTRLKGARLPGGARAALASGPMLLTVAGVAWVLVGLAFLARALHGGPVAWLGGGVILLCAMGTCGLVGFCVERLAYKPLRAAPRLNVLITAIGVSLFLQNLGQLEWMFGTRPQPMPQLLPDHTLAMIGTTPIRLLDVICGGTALALMFALDRLVFATKLGRAMRAVSYNDRTAALMGIPVDRIISFTFVLGAVLAAAAGFLYAQKYPGLNQTAAPVWVLLGLKAFVAAVIGGIGNVRGAMLGGLLIGLLEFFGVAYARDLAAMIGIQDFPGEQLRDVYVFAALIIVLLVRPAGILGSDVQEKV